MTVYRDVTSHWRSLNRKIVAVLLSFGLEKLSSYNCNVFFSRLEDKYLAT